MYTTSMSDSVINNEIVKEVYYLNNKSVLNHVSMQCIPGSQQNSPYSYHTKCLHEGQDIETGGILCHRQ